MLDENAAVDVTSRAVYTLLNYIFDGGREGGRESEVGYKE